jgi:hypothetical protein
MFRNRGGFNAPPEPSMQNREYTIGTRKTRANRMPSNCTARTISASSGCLSSDLRPPFAASQRREKRTIAHSRKTNYTTSMENWQNALCRAPAVFSLVLPQLLSVLNLPRRTLLAFAAERSFGNLVSRHLAYRSRPGEPGHAELNIPGGFPRDGRDEYPP